MPRTRHPWDGAPDCPLCGGPCTHEFERSEYVFPDRLPRADPEPEPEPKPPRTATRAHRPAEDRMHRPAEDRGGYFGNAEPREAIVGPGETVKRPDQ